MYILALISSQLKDAAVGVWIGLFKESSSDVTFKWVDSSPLNFLNWAPNEPNSDFVSIFTIAWLPVLLNLLMRDKI